MVTIFSIVAMLLSITGQVCIAYKKIIAFPIWIVSNILWIVVNIIGPLNVPQLITFMVYTIFTGFSWYKWK